MDKPKYFSVEVSDGQWFSVRVGQNEERDWEDAKRNLNRRGFALVIKTANPNDKAISPKQLTTTLPGN